VLSDEQWFGFAGFALFSTVFTADAVFNWGLFRARKRWWSSRETRYGPIERVLRIGVGVMLMLVVFLAASIVVTTWLRPPEPELASPRKTETLEPPSTVEPATGETRPAPPQDDDFHFWLYEDDAGRTHMVDAFEKVPPAYRSSAREKR
jgi:hypothetical protein